MLFVVIVCCVQLLFDGRLTEAVLFSYNAKAVDGQLCLESSPIANPSPFVHSPHATLLEVLSTHGLTPFLFSFILFIVFSAYVQTQGVDPVVTNSFQSALHSLGGLQVREGIMEVFSIF